MTVKELKQILDEARIEYPDDALKADLEELVGDMAEDIVEHAELSNDESDEARVLYGQNKVARVYSRALHGDNFRELAAQFAESRGWRVE